MEKENILYLKQLMEDKQVLSDKYKELKAEVLFKFETEHENLISEMNKADDFINITKESISSEALAIFNETEEKKFFGGISIKEYTKILYEDVKALEWVKVNMPVAVIETFNKKQFELFAKKTPPKFVTITKTPRVTFPASRRDANK